MVVNLNPNITLLVKLLIKEGSDNKTDSMVESQVLISIVALSRNQTIDRTIG